MKLLIVFSKKNQKVFKSIKYFMYMTDSLENILYVANPIFLRELPQLLKQNNVEIEKRQIEEIISQVKAQMPKERGFITDFDFKKCSYVIVDETGNEQIDKFLLNYASLVSAIDCEFDENKSDLVYQAYNTYLKLPKITPEEAIYSTCLALTGGGFQNSPDEFNELSSRIEIYLIKREPHFCIEKFYNAQQSVLSQIIENNEFASGKVKFVGENE
jgi:hypothetical protein